MGLLDKMKNLFTEEVEEEPRRVEPRRVEQPVRRVEQRVDIPTPKPVVETIEKPVPKVVEQPKDEAKPKEDKFVYFTDDDFKDLEPPKKVEVKKPVKKEEKETAYKGTINKQPEVKKEFKPSPIISPVYGVLEKDYEKDDIKPRRISSKKFRTNAITVDDIRNKAYGTVEDDIKDDLLGKALVEQVREEKEEPNINIFDELDKIKEPEVEPDVPEISRSTSDVDEIFGRLDNKKDEILGELDNKKDEILDVIDTKTNSIDLLSSDVEEDSKKSNNDVELAKGLLDDEEAEQLAQELEEQKKKLDEINNMMNENEEVTKNKKVEDDLEESELFNLIDSTYEKKDDE